LGNTLNSNENGYNYGVFLQDDWHFTPDWHANLGARFDQTSASGNRISPRVALIYDLDKITTIKAIYGQAFRAPNAYELYYGNPVGGVLQTGNSSLKPETISNFELAIEHNTGATRWLASAYHYILKDLSSQVDIGGGVLQYQNSEPIDANGIEFEVERRLNNGVHLRASYALQKVESIDLPNSPRHNAKINMSIPLFNNLALLGVEGQYVSSRFTQESTITTTPEVLFNLNLTTDKLIPKVDLSFGIHNVFNRHNEEPASTDMPQLVNVQDGRIVNLKAVYHF
jgi:iron complex outermembrane receptor protein